MSVITAPPPRRTFGNWVRPRSPGLRGLGLLGTALLFTGLVFSLLATLFSSAAAVVVAVLFAVPVALSAAPVGGRSLATILLTRLGWWRRRWGRQHQYRTGLLSNVPAGVGRPLPGVLASSGLLQTVDGAGRVVAVIYRPGKNFFTVVLRCLGDGVGLVERDVIDAWVSGYGGLLAALGQEPGLKAASVIVDTAPATGTRLRAEHERTMVADAPDLARQVMDEVVATYPSAAPETAVYVALTYAGSALHRRARDTASVMRELLRRLPGLAGALEQAGGGTVEPLSPIELAAVVRSAYDPAAHHDLAAAAAAGEPVELGWDEAGPVATQESWGALRHDSGISLTWEMYGAPRGTVFDDVLAPLVEPHTDFLRKRVAVIYRAHGPADAARITERDAQSVTLSARKPGGRLTAMTSREIESTQQAEHDVAAGAGLTRFAVVVTATVAHEDDLPQAVATIGRLGRMSRLSLRRSWGHQAAAFALTLPVGFLPWEHTLIPADLRE